MTQPLLTYKEAAALLKVGVSTLRLYKRQGKVRFVRIGGSVRFRAVDLEDCAREHLVREPVES